MELDVIEKQPKFYKQIKEALNKGFLSHSYLIESVNLRDEQVNKYIRFFVKTIYDNYYDDNISISKEKIFHLVDNLEFPDYIEIRPVNNVIKKEQLLRVRDDFSNKSLYNTKKIYTVYNADKMNVNSSNTILKFLEEPNDDVIALFVTNNQYNVLDTIRSRCQIISLQYEDVPHQYSEDLINFFEDIKLRKNNNLLLKFNSYNNNLFKDKNMAVSTMTDTLNYYKEMLNKNMNGDLEDLKETMMIVSILEEELKKLKYNVNIKLWLDNLLLSIMEV